MVLRVIPRPFEESAKICSLPDWQQASLAGPGCLVDRCHNGS